MVLISGWGATSVTKDSKGEDIFGFPDKLQVLAVSVITRSGVNFINVLCTAFALLDPKRVKNTGKSPVSFLRFWDL